MKYTEMTTVLPHFNTLVVNMIQYHVVQYIHNKKIKKKIIWLKSLKVCPSQEVKVLFGSHFILVGLLYFTGNNLFEGVIIQSNYIIKYLVIALVLTWIKMYLPCN